MKVIEVMPPLVNTDFAKAMPGEKISEDEVAEAILAGLENDVFEIHAGPAALYALHRSSALEAFKILNKV